MEKALAFKLLREALEMAYPALTERLYALFPARRGFAVGVGVFSLLEKPHFTIHFDHKMILDFRKVVADSNKRELAKYIAGILQKYGV